ALEVRGELVVVDAQHAGQVGTVLGRGRKHDPLGARLKMRVVAGLLVGGPRGEDAGAFQGDVHIQFAPGKLAGVALGEGPDLLAVDGQVFIVERYGTRITPVRAVVLQQRGQHFVAGKVVDGDHFEDVRTRHQIPEDKSADTPEAVDCDANWHGFQLLDAGG